MQQLADLLFILASLDRLTLLSEIDINKQKLSQITSKISATPQEASKHLMRLRNAEIIEKDSEGFFYLTSFGKTILRLLPGLEFASNNREYFLSHDISLLPLEFNERLGELCDSEFTDRVGPLLSYIRQIVTEAEEYIWLMADHPIGGDDYVGGKKLETSDVKWRVIIPRGTDFDEAIYHSPSPQAKHRGRIEYALITDSKNIKAGIVLNEKRAGVTFPDMTGKLDFNSGFRSNDPLFHKWCFDLFNSYWNKATRKVVV
jgi:predicted transcriptional regulator